MQPSVYLETSVIGYLTSRPSRDIIVAAQQQLTQEWWADRRDDFDFIFRRLSFKKSELVMKRKPLGGFKPWLVCRCSIPKKE